MTQISINVPDGLFQQLANDGEDPAVFFQERLLSVAANSVAAKSTVTPSLAQKFQTLAAQWRQETRHLSLMSDIVLNTAYQQIVGMGMPAIPLLLKELQERPDHWFWALRSITGENPILPDDRGRVTKMAKAWLQWGKDHGYQC